MTLTSFNTETFDYVSLITSSASLISSVFFYTREIGTKFKRGGTCEVATTLFVVSVPVLATDPVGVVASWN